MKKARALKNKLTKIKSPQTFKAQRKESNREAQRRCRNKMTPNTNRKRLDVMADKARQLYYATSPHTRTRAKKKNCSKKAVMKH